MREHLGNREFVEPALHDTREVVVHVVKHHVDAPLVRIHHVRWNAEVRGC